MTFKSSLSVAWCETFINVNIKDQFGVLFSLPSGFRKQCVQSVQIIIVALTVYIAIMSTLLFTSCARLKTRLKIGHI
jgi:hypothetical protein